MGLTLSDISKMTGLHRGHLSEISNDIKTPNLINAYKISWALGEDINIVFPFESND